MPLLIGNTEDLIAFHDEVCGKARAIIASKNADYAGNEDPFGNFHEYGHVGIEVRLSDKWARWKNFCKRGTLKVLDESIEDTLIDIINYLILWMAYRRRRRNDAIATTSK